MPVPSKRDFFVAVPQAGNRCNEPFFQGPRPRLASPPLPLTVVVDNAVAARREGLAAPDPTPAQPAPLPPPSPPPPPPPPWRLPPRPSSSLSLKPRPSKRVLEDYRHLPLRKVDPEMFDVAAFPKMSPKPFDSPSFQRACKARTPDERCEGRRECLDDDDHVPVDVKRQSLGIYVALLGRNRVGRHLISGKNTERGRNVGLMQAVRFARCGPSSMHCSGRVNVVQSFSIGTRGRRTVIGQGSRKIKASSLLMR